MSILALAVGVNVFQTPVIERSDSLHTATPHIGGGLEQATGEMRYLRVRYLVYLQLGEVAAGGRLTTFDGSGVLRDSVLGLSRLTVVEVADYDPEVSGELARRLRDQAVHTGESRDVGEYAIVAPARPGEVEMVTVTGDGTTFFVPRDRLSAGTADG